MTIPKQALELKPCPFCGGADVEAVDSLDFVSCQNCGASLEDSEPSARELWNTRSAASLQGEDAVERVARIKSLLASFHRSSCYPEAMTGELNDAAERILATGLVPDEAAVRAELSEVRQEATDSLRVLDAIADYVGCPHDEELTVDHVRQHYMKLENAAQRQGIEDAARIANAQAYVTVNEAAIRADEREKCAKRIEPKRPRPCDCERCDCHNQGDAEAVAVWDADAAAAAAIRSGGGE